MLIGNYNVFNKSAGKWLTGTSSAHTGGVGTNTSVPAQAFRASDWRKFSIADRAGGPTTARNKTAAKPYGYAAPSGAFALAETRGGLSAVNQLRGEATLTGPILQGRGLESATSATASLSGTAQLVVSGEAAITASATLSGAVVASLAAESAITASATFTGAVVGQGNAAAAITASATLTAPNYGTGTLAANIAPPVDLDAATFSAYLLDTESVETGLTVRNALKLLSAALAGELSGAGSTTITIRNAVADSKNRIVATVDGTGNRTAITYDLS